MEISKELTDQIKKDLENFKKTGEDNFLVEGFDNIFIYFNRIPKNILFPLGQIDEVKIYLGSE
jgi:hypothetical protein